MTDDDRVFLARMGERLKDSNTSVRFAVVRGIGEQTQAPAEAIPLLIAALDDGDDRVSSEAVGALSGFGTNAANALPKLSNLVNTGSPAQARSALKALAAIDPVAALPVLSNAVVNGSSATLVAALKNLKTIAPELALEMVLAEFQSTDARRRSQVILAVVDYDVTTPGIAGALKSAAADPDPEIAGRAVMVMKQMLRKQKEAMGGYVQMPDEPVYQGKPLGEWLRMKQPDGWDLSTNAVQALQRMGTNVISALLARLTYKEPVFILEILT
ncbi:MAG: HEAT repeat domain-containing protein [Limisphaerales bacterium]